MRTNKTPSLDDSLTREEFRARFNAEAAKVQRHYCTLFAFWRACRFKLCRREQACRGDHSECLKALVDRVPRRQQFDARMKLLQETPRNLGAPERAAREFMPSEPWAFRPQLIPRGWTRPSARRSRSPSRKSAKR